MSTDDIIYCVAHGIGFAYLCPMGLLMLLVKKSICSDVRTRPGLRRLMGFTLLAWGLTYLTGIYFYTCTELDVTYRDNLNFLMDLVMTIPVTLCLLSCIPHVGNLKISFSVFNGLLGLGLTVAYGITANEMLMLGTLIFWIFVILHFLFFYAHDLIVYQRILRNEFSDYSGVSIRWLYRAVCFVVFYAAVLVLGMVLRLEALYFFSFIFILAVWTYIAYCVDTMKAIPDIRRLRSILETQDREEKEGELLLTEEEDEGLASLLHTECEEKLLYLQNNLTINQLAISVGTNRTYLWKHFRDNNTNFHSYINKLRFEYSKRLLVKNEKPNIAQIARDSGFGSDATFRRIFQELCGCSPTQYIVKMKEDKLVGGGVN